MFMNKTISYYNKNSSNYFNYTVNADMKEQYKMFLKYIKNCSRILDLGCGSGRDTKYFLDHGFIVDAIDGSEELCKLASIYTGINVKCMNFSDLDIIEYYDAVWACSSLLHVPKNKFKDILIKVRDSLKLNGILYASLKDGIGEEELNGRYYNYFTKDEFITVASEVGFSLIESAQSTSVINKNERKWNNFVLEKKL